MPILGQCVLELAAALVTLGGLYDLLTPKMPPHLTEMCNESEKASKLVRELLRALGGALVAIGLTVAALAATVAARNRHQTLILVLLLVLPAEGTNAYCMRRVGSPFIFLLGFALLTLLGVLLAWPGSAVHNV